jgi:hypothetical protein
MPVGHLLGLVRAKDQHAMGSLKVFHRDSRASPAIREKRGEDLGIGVRYSRTGLPGVLGLKD